MVEAEIAQAVRETYGPVYAEACDAIEAFDTQVYMAGVAVNQARSGITHGDSPVIPDAEGKIIYGAAG